MGGRQGSGARAVQAPLRPAVNDAWRRWADRFRRTWWRRAAAISALVEVSALGCAAVLVVPWSLPAGVLVALGAATLVLEPRPSRIVPRPWEGAGSLAGRLALPLGVVAPFADDAGTCAGWAAVVVVVVSARAAVRLAAIALRARGVLRERVVVVGRSATASELRRTLAYHDEFGLDVVGPPPAAEGEIAEWLSSIPAHASRVDASRVIVAADELAADQLAHLLASWDHRIAALHLLEGRRTSPLGAPVDDVWGFCIEPRPLRAQEMPAWALKRAFDITAAAVALVAVAPALVGIALLIRVTSGRPVLFRQERIGPGGLPFTMLKFRTLPVSHDANASWNGASGAEPTPVGRLLRDTSLDELPQLLNILRGDMSLVGPRPEIPRFAADFNASVHGYSARTRVPVGLTGWAQVHGLRGATSIEARARFDNHYIDGWSLRRDLLILCRTVVAVCRPTRRRATLDCAPVIDLREPRPDRSGDLVAAGGRAP